MAIDTNVQTFTDAELLAMFRLALVNVSTGQSYAINGRALTRADLSQIRETIEWLEERVNAASTEAQGGLALVRYGEPQ